MRLTNGSRVVIIGGGPAGSLTALHLLRFAAEAGLQLDLTIVEARDFRRAGPGGCNKCAGILSSTFLRHLQSLDLRLPPEIIQSELDAYVLHLDRATLPIHRPDPARRIFSVYRGGGPRLGGPPLPHSFDGWLLDQARARGAGVRRGLVQTVAPGPRPVVVLAHERLEADLVIAASGVNSRVPLAPAWGYRPPRVEPMAQDEVPLPASLADGGAHIFFAPPAGLIFGALIPKGRYASLSLLGRGLPPEAIREFLEAHDLLRLFPDDLASLCGCTPRIVTGPAAGYYADRLVVVGDAAVTRLYKDGIGTAFLTAQAAARTAVQRGLARSDFDLAYRPVCEQIEADNRYGRLLLWLWDAIRQRPGLLEAWRQAVLAEASQMPETRIHTRVVWGMFTGDESYRQLFWLAISRPALQALWRGVRRPAGGTE